MEVRVHFIQHSGILVCLEGNALLFDYYRGKLPREELTSAERRYIFASHGHRDHFVPEIFSLAGEHTSFILSADIADSRSIPASVGDTLLLEGGVSVRVFGSTDEGVSYLVNCGGLQIFHAGDLNLWSWLVESTEEEIRQAREDFSAVLDSMQGVHPDIAFFPYDKRMGRGFDEGIQLFCQRFAPKYILPMHYEDRCAQAADFCPANIGSVPLIPKAAGEIFKLNF